VEILNYRNSLPLGSMLLEYRLESITHEWTEVVQSVKR